MHNEWTVTIFPDDTETGDGWLAAVGLTDRQGGCLSGYCVYGERLSFVFDVVRNDFRLTPIAARRVLTIIYEEFGEGLEGCFVQRVSLNDLFTRHGCEELYRIISQGMRPRLGRY